MAGTGTLHFPRTFPSILPITYWAVTSDPHGLPSKPAKDYYYDEYKIEHTNPFGQTELSLRTRHPNRASLGNDRESGGGMGFTTESTAE